MKTHHDWFVDVYSKFKMYFYSKLFGSFQGREASLTTTEAFCVDIIYFLDNPTVREFAEFAHLSTPNATYKINSLVKKGYVTRVQSETDRREVHLQVTDKYLRYHAISYNYIEEVVDRVRERFSEKDLEKFDEILETIATELMPEVNIPLQRNPNELLGEAGS
jgi:DNA-binding MarR family transcriptional regulator